MLPWIIQMSIISLILIILVHYLFTFFMTNLTIPKVKDLVNKPQQQYEVLYNTMREQPKPQNESVTLKTENQRYLQLMKLESHVACYFDCLDKPDWMILNLSLT